MLYNGNYPNLVRQAIALRRTSQTDRKIWQEYEALEENIYSVDLVWRAVNYTLRHQFMYIKRRVILWGPLRPFCYNHYENIKKFTRKEYLQENLEQFYSNNELFANCSYHASQSLYPQFLIVI